MAINTITKQPYYTFVTPILTVEQDKGLVSIQILVLEKGGTGREVSIIRKAAQKEQNMKNLYYNKSKELSRLI